MNEECYWGDLEYRVCREFNGIDEFRRIGLWCDGFLPAQYDLQADPPCIHGVAWICPGKDQQRWEFTLVLNQRPADLTQIDWGALLPAEEVTEWLALDFEKSHIEINPGAAVTGTP